jgi:hypothetical protein
MKNLTLTSRLLRKQYSIVELNSYFNDLSERFKDGDNKMPIKLYENLTPYYTSSKSKSLFSILCGYVAYVNYPFNIKSSFIFMTLSGYFLLSKYLEISFYTYKAKAIYLSFEKEEDCSLVKNIENQEKIPVLLINYYDMGGLIDVRLDSLKEIKENKIGEIEISYDRINSEDGKIILDKDFFIDCYETSNNI